VTVHALPFVLLHPLRTVASLSRSSPNTDGILRQLVFGQQQIQEDHRWCQRILGAIAILRHRLLIMAMVRLRVLHH